jgi:hypothetical protein
MDQCTNCTFSMHLRHCAACACPEFPSGPWLTHQAHGSHIRRMAHTSGAWLTHQAHGSHIRPMAHTEPIRPMAHTELIALSIWCATSPCKGSTAGRNGKVCMGSGTSLHARTPKGTGTSAEPQPAPPRRQGSRTPYLSSVGVKVGNAR